MKIIDLIKNLESYEKILVEAGARNSKIIQIKRGIEFFRSFSTMTIDELEEQIKQNKTYQNKSLIKDNNKANSKHTLENKELLKAVNLFKKTIKGIKLLEEEWSFLEQYSTMNPQIKKIINLEVKDLPEFFYNQNFIEWKINEIKFFLMFYFSETPIQKKSKKEMIDILQNQVYQSQYVSDLNNLKKD